MTTLDGPVESASAIVIGAGGEPINVRVPVTDVAVTPTQVRRPWRSTLRTVFQALLALAVMLPILVQAAGLDADKIPWLAGVLIVAAGITRVMALPAVEEFLRRFLPFLAAAPAPERQDEAGESIMVVVAVVALVVLLLWLLFGGVR